MHTLTFVVILVVLAVSIILLGKMNAEKLTLDLNRLRFNSGNIDANPDFSNWYVRNVDGCDLTMKSKNGCPCRNWKEGQY